MSFAIAALAMQAGGSVLSGFGQIQQAKMDYGIAKYNAELDKAASYDVLESSFRDEEMSRRDYEAFRGEQEVAVGKSGVAFEGSILDVLADGSARAELDAMNIRFAGQQQAASLQEGARAGMIQAKASKRQAYIGAAASLVSGAGQTYGSGHSMGVFK